MKKKEFLNLFKYAEILYRGLTSPLRVSPDFIIIGAQKCGTTSLYNYLIQHPCIFPAFRKELNFFDIGFQRGNLWYRSYFPTAFYKTYKERIYNQNTITGEATPQYLFHPLAAERIAQTLPNAKFIVLLRNPVTRAFSHFNHMKVRGFESLSFEEALERESSIMKAELEKINQNRCYHCTDFLNHSYVSRGIYIDQLKRWMIFFPREQFLFIKYEDFTTDPATSFRDALNFLGLPEWELSNYSSFNSGKYSSSLNLETKKYLMDFFEPYNQRLYEFLDTSFDW